MHYKNAKSGNVDFFFLFAHATFWKQSKTKQENFQSSLSTKMSHKQKFCNFEALSNMTKKWNGWQHCVYKVSLKLVAMLHWLPLKEDISKLISIYLLTELVERIIFWQKIIEFSL